MQKGTNTTRGIILVDGTGSRLPPITLGISRQLVPIYDKPVICYLLNTLMLAGIRGILVIAILHDAPQLECLLGGGLRWGLNLTSATQDQPRDLVEIFIIGANHIGDNSVALILGDNTFCDAGLGTQLRHFHDVDGEAIFTYWVADPVACGVMDSDRSSKAIAVQEKPKKPHSRFAIPGLYFYGTEIVEIAHSLQPSSHGELEITNVNRVYLERGGLQVEVLPRGMAQLDTDTIDNLMVTGDFVHTIGQRRGLKTGSPEEVAWRMGFVDDAVLSTRADALSTSGYGEYLQQLLLHGKNV